MARKEERNKGNTKQKTKMAIVILYLSRIILHINGYLSTKRQRAAERILKGGKYMLPTKDSL